MKIEHLAIYTKNLERLRSFYEKFFGAASNAKYVNSRGFESYFLTFSDGARLEIMTYPELDDGPYRDYVTGFVHMAFSVGSKDSVLKLTEEFRTEGYEILSEPRSTGDGYFESCVADPDGNRVELTV